MSIKKDLPIGVYDSGVGGVSTLKQIETLLPNENYIYYGDNANAPYGTRDFDEIRELSIACGEFLYHKGVKMIVIACNTATSIVVKTLRARYNVPVISMEPAIKPASIKYKEGKIAVLATPATLQQNKYKSLVRDLDLGDRVVSIGCAGLVELIEEGDLQSPKIKQCLREKLAPLQGHQVSALVIGCTHYSFVIQQIQDVADEMLEGAREIFDGRFGTAQRVVDVLKREGLLTDRKEKGKVTFYSSMDGNDVRSLEAFYAQARTEI